jgi:hypothetical protein
MHTGQVCAVTVLLAGAIRLDRARLRGMKALVVLGEAHDDGGGTMRTQLGVMRGREATGASKAPPHPERPQAPQCDP